MLPTAWVKSTGTCTSRQWARTSRTWCARTSLEKLISTSSAARDYTGSTWLHRNSNLIKRHTPKWFFEEWIYKRRLMQVRDTDKRLLWLPVRERISESLENFPSCSRPCKSIGNLLIFVHNHILRSDIGFVWQFIADAVVIPSMYCDSQ